MATEKEILPLGRTTATYQSPEEQRKEVQREQMAEMFVKWKLITKDKWGNKKGREKKNGGEEGRKEGKKRKEKKIFTVVPL